MHKAGFVNIVGNPNVGKSTLMNQLVGERISIATFKAQTTRHRIMGIVNTPEMQIVFSDTPGVLKPNYKMQEMMLAFSESALQDADVLLYVTDVVENPEKNMDFLEKVQKMTIPVLLLINKIDNLTSDSTPKGEGSSQQKLGDIVAKWHTLLPNAEILPISAKNKFGVDMLTSPPASSFRKSSARKSCSTTTRRFLMPWKCVWTRSRRRKIASTSTQPSMWSASRRRASSSVIRALH